MADEVTRLRKLRRVALKARALARVLRTPDDRRDAVQARGALLCWRINRICSGRLRAHPYEDYQRGPALSETLNDGFEALVAGLVARRLGRRANRFQAYLKNVAQTLDDVRALTLIPELSDDFGRAQADMRQLLSELSLRAQLERGHAPQTAARAADLPADARPEVSQYLAL